VSAALLLILKGMLSDVPQETRDKVQEAREKIVAIVQEYGDEGFVALAVVAAEVEDD
jgi:hypothetical protein